MRRDARVVTRAVADAEADEDGKPRARLVRGADGKFVREGSEGGGGRGETARGERRVARATAPRQRRHRATQHVAPPTGASASVRRVAVRVPRRPDAPIGARTDERRRSRNVMRPCF